MDADPDTDRSSARPLLRGVTATSLGTLVSRATGVLRESATAALLGMSQGGIMDAYVVALRIPNLLRRLFGEGAMTASYLPVLSAELERDRRRAWQLVSAAGLLLAVVLIGLTLLAEAICGLLLVSCGEQPGFRLVLGLTAVTLPYTVLVCLAALASATLQALGEFRLPALAPAVANVAWIVCAWLVAPRISSDPHVQAYLMAACVLVGGALQLAVQLPRLRKSGWRPAIDLAASRQSLSAIARGMAPTTLGLAITQINTLVDSLLARGLSSSPDGPRTITWLGGVAYPLRQGAAAAVWYAERVYQFPVGLLGIAVATVSFPLLSRHAAAGRHEEAGKQLTLALRLVLFGAIPATAGLMLLAEPITRLLYERRNFTAADTPRAAAMVACYGLGVWAFCAIPTLVRAYYAIGDRRTPLRVGAICVVVNLALNLVLIWPLAERALAVSTSVAAMLQAVLLAAGFARGPCRIAWRPLMATGARCCASTLVMAVACQAALSLLPMGPHSSVATVLAVGIAILAYLTTYLVIGGGELWALAGRRNAVGGLATAQREPRRCPAPAQPAQFEPL